MRKQKEGKLNYLLNHLPEGLVVDAAWLTRKGYSTSLRSQYVTAGWLEQPARRVFRRPAGKLRWQQAVISLQTLLERSLTVGGRTALELEGYEHYLNAEITEVHLYGTEEPPSWLNKLRVGARFYYHNAVKLFGRNVSTKPVTDLNWGSQHSHTRHADSLDATLAVYPWGQWDWPLTISTPERAIFEILDALPKRESFDQADKLFEGLSSLSPARLERLLAECRSVKVKRLFLFFADRHHHAWSKHLKTSGTNLGKGKRMLVKGGRLDSKYEITVPEELFGVQ